MISATEKIIGLALHGSDPLWDSVEIAPVLAKCLAVAVDALKKENTSASMWALKDIERIAAEEK